MSPAKDEVALDELGLDLGLECWRPTELFNLPPFSEPVPLCNAGVISR